MIAVVEDEKELCESLKMLLTSGAGIITVNLTTLLTTIAAIAVTIILSMAYPVIKILHYDSVEVLGSDD